MEKNRVRLLIGGSEFLISTEDEMDYVVSLGAELDERVKKICQDNPRVSLTQAAILVALDYADECKKAVSSADNLRAQIKDYLEDSARARMEADVSRREIERLNRELSTLRMKLADAGKR